MNFFGHACLAARRDPSAGFVLGAMLPDLVNMLGASRVSSTRAPTAAGIRFHHATDHVFHESQTFKELAHASSAWLRERAVSRGAARAVGHVGTEMLLDTCLSAKAPFLLSYREALNLGTHTAELEGLCLSPIEAAPNLPALCVALRNAIPQLRDQRPELIAARLVRTLARRPRLALKPSEVSVASDWAQHFTPRVQSVAEPWLREIESALGED